MSIKLFGYPIKHGDNVYSASMGSGKVESVTASGIYINHSGQRWRYNAGMVRSGCKLSDLSWHPKDDGLQIKSKKQRSASAAVVAELSIALRRHYG